MGRLRVGPARTKNEMGGHAERRQSAISIIMEMGLLVGNFDNREDEQGTMESVAADGGRI